MASEYDDERVPDASRPPQLQTITTVFTQGRATVTLVHTDSSCDEAFVSPLTEVMRVCVRGCILLIPQSLHT